MPRPPGPGGTPPGLTRLSHGWELHTGGEEWYRVHAGEVIRVEGFPLEGTLPAESVLRLIGPVTALVADAAGLVPLHAAGVGRKGKMLAISAPGGTGKSSLASLALAEGFAVLGDDLLAVDDRGWIAPMPGILRARPEWFPDHDVPGGQLPDGRSWLELEAPEDAPRLAGLVRLERGDRPALESVEGVARLATVAGAGVLTFFDDDNGETHPPLLDLAARIPAWRLTVPEGRESMMRQWPAIAGLLEEALDR